MIGVVLGLSAEPFCADLGLQESEISRDSAKISTIKYLSCSSIDYQQIVEALKLNKLCYELLISLSAQSLKLLYISGIGSLQIELIVYG